LARESISWFGRWPGGWALAGCDGGQSTAMARAPMKTRTGTGSTGWPAYAAAGWAFVFAVPHVYWGSGGRAGLAAAVSAQLATGRSTEFLALNWGIALFCVAGAGVALAATRGGERGAARRVVRLLLWLGFALLLLRVLDIVIELAVGVVTLDRVPADTRAQFERLAPWFAVLWLPWFSLGTVLFGLTAGRSGLRRREPA
jgi:hypothetical protein